MLLLRLKMSRSPFTVGAARQMPLNETTPHRTGRSLARPASGLLVWYDSYVFPESRQWRRLT